MISETGVQQWLAYAEADRQAAEHLLESGDYMACAFHNRQNMESLLAETSEVYQWFLTKLNEMSKSGDS